MVLFRHRKSVMIVGWGKRGDYWTNIDSLDFVREPAYRGYSETREPWSSDLSGGKKNGMWLLRDSPSKLLRQESTAHTGSILRGCSDLSGSGDPAGTMPEVWESEAGGVGLVSQQSILHEAVFLLRGAKVPCDDHTGCGKRAEAGLADGKGVREGIYAGATSPQSCSSAPGDWD